MPPTILLVEDDEAQRIAATYTLENILPAGTDLQVAGTLQEAKARLADAPDQPWLILSDARLPDGSGYEWVVQLRAAGHEAVVLTAGGETRADVPVHIKPADLDEQEALFARIIELWQARRNA